MLQLNIGASEWGIIFLLLLLLIVGSNKLSGLARLLGRATGEYEKAKELIQNEKENSRSTDSIISTSPFVPRILGPVGSEREKLETIAKALGIEQGELTEDQLRSLISQKIQKR
ncbi:MAG: Sec-independent protein secretion pathway component [Nitrososphaeraceae archaeon]|jgi:sec-independent protein translocase protein TatA|nr:Sec-independent protein secretion pathway component [Nitrososphaeraceae archaeon]